MNEPSPRKTRLALAGGVAAALMLGGGGFLVGRSTTDRPTVPVAPPKPAVVAPATPGTLGRADLIALAAGAADALAAGRNPNSEGMKTDGRRFEIRLPIGCDGPADETSDADLRWLYDSKAKAVRIHVAALVWSAVDWGAVAPTHGIDAIEGFWITRPWTSSEACPAERKEQIEIGADPVVLPRQTLALGQIFLSDDARAGKREGKPYQAVVPIAENELSVADGLHLRLSGRVARVGADGPVLCHQPGGRERQPVCLVSVLLDELAIEIPATGKEIATWSVAGSVRPTDTSKAGSRAD